MLNEQNLRIALVRARLSQNRLAQRLGLHPSVFSAVVRGYRKLEPGLRRKICEELGVEDQLLFGPSIKRGATVEVER